LVKEVPVAEKEREAQERTEPLLTVKQAAAIVGCHEESIRRAYTAKQLRIVKFGMRSIRIRRSDLDDWLARGGKTRAA